MLLVWTGVIIGVLFLVSGCSVGEQAREVVPRFSVLVFSKTDTAGYRHASIPNGVQTVRELGQTHYFEVEATEDAAVFTSDRLGDYDAVVFLNTSGDVLDENEQAAFEEYIRAGGGYVGIHGAAATEYDWAWYGGLVGAFFDDHPPVQQAEIEVVNDTDPSTLHLSSPWTWTDEWYNFRTNPTDSVEVLLEVHEESYDGGTMGEQHPIAWKQRYDGGRSFYTGLGHTEEAFDDPVFRRHLHEGIEWAAGGLDPFVEPEFPFLTTTVDAGGLASFLPERNRAVRGIAMPLGDSVYASFDPDLLRMSAGWTGAFVSMTTMAQVSYDEPFNKSNDIPRVLGDPVFATGLYPGWTAGAPQFEDPRPIGPNPEDPGRGPLAAERGRWHGLHVVENGVVLSYSVRETDILEHPSSVRRKASVGIARTFRVGAGDHPLSLVATEVRSSAGARVDSATAIVSHGRTADSLTAVGLVGGPDGAEIQVLDDRYVTVRLPQGRSESRFRIVLWTGRRDALSRFREMLAAPIEMPDVESRNTTQWPHAVHTRGRRARDTSAFVVDELTLPLPNPWSRNVRVADVDFFADGRAGVVTFSGDVWIVSGISETMQQLRWRRFASGLYEPLTLSVVDGQIYVYGREGIVRLHDRNGDGEADFYENFSNRMIQSSETREWPLDMAPRSDGGFFVSIGAALNAGPETEATRAVLPGFRIGSQHAGTILGVSPDGEQVDVFADGFREPYLGRPAPGRPLTASDQQGNFVPSTPVYAVEEGNYYGVPATRSRSGPVPEPASPLSWIPHAVDPSGTSQLWMDGANMGPLNNSLVHFSYSRPGLFRVYPDTAQRPWQGAVAPIGGPHDTPTIKGQIHPNDGQLYVAGFQVWGSQAAKLSGLQRLRYTGQSSRMPTDVRAGKQGILLRFEHPLDSASVDPSSSTVQRWNYQRSEAYGSGRYRLDGSSGTETLPVAVAHLSSDRRAVLLVVPDVEPVQQLEVNYGFEGEDGRSLEGPVYLTLNEARPLALEDEGFRRVDWQKDLETRDKTRVDTPRTDDASAAADGIVSAERGRHIYQEIGCQTCHSLDGSEAGHLGPTFQGLFGAQRPLQNGETVVADEAYLEQSIRAPASQSVEGYPPNMPTYEGVLSDAEIASLVELIRSLEGDASP